MSMEETEALKRALRKKKTADSPIKVADLLSSGSTLLNLACSGRALGCFMKGTYYLFVGDSSSGKTFLALTCLAEAARSKHFKNYRLIYDNAENGALMAMAKFFGERMASRLELPGRDDAGTPCPSTTVEEFYYNVDDACQRGEPFIYIMDSMDALDSEDDATAFEDNKKASRKGKETKGSYGTAKAKMNSTGLRKIISKLGKTGSILVIISQTRDNIGFGAQFNPKTRAGGKALKFYATLEIWSSIKEAIKKTIKGKSRQLGVLSKVQVKKNRINGRDRTVYVPIYHSMGIDDVGSCVDYLVEEGHWKLANNGIKATELDVVLKRESLIRHIETEGIEPELRSIVEEVWTAIEEACAPNRKMRYDD